MKKLSVIAFALLCMFNVGCNKKNDQDKCSARGQYSGSAQVVKDCTGTYIRYSNKDYLVCNSEQLAGAASGAWVTTSFNKVDICVNMELPTCNVVHEHSGSVEIICIR